MSMYKGYWVDATTISAIQKFYISNGKTKLLGFESAQKARDFIDKYMDKERNISKNNEESYGESTSAVASN
jgi:hypothetical protein